MEVTKPKFHIKKKAPNYKDVFKNAVNIIDYCFSIDDEDFWQLNDFNNVPSIRGFRCLELFKELNMGCDRDYLKTFSQAFKDIINNPSGIKLTDLMKLETQMEERLEFLIEPDIAYKLCGVVFFSSKESPYSFEDKNNILKANLFKSVGADFFLNGSQTPIGKLIPFIASSTADSWEYSQMILGIKEKQIRDISTMLSAHSKNSEFYKRLLSQSIEA